MTFVEVSFFAIDEKISRKTYSLVVKYVIYHVPTKTVFCVIISALVGFLAVLFKLALSVLNTF